MTALTNRDLMSLMTQQAQAARGQGDPERARLFIQQRDSLRPLRYRRRPARRRLIRFAPRGIVGDEKRYFGRPLRPVVGVDIDGTLGDWHGQFTWFAEHYLQRKLPWSWDGTIPFYQSLGISRTTYRTLKLAFRQSGLKRAMPLLPGAWSLTNEVRKAGAELWICTTRPYLRLDNIDPDTRWWLRHHRLNYDGVLFGEKKFNDLKKLFGERIVAVIDDLPEYVERASTAELPAFLLDKTYNRHAASLSRMLSLAAAESAFLEKIEEFKEKCYVG